MNILSLFFHFPGCKPVENVNLKPAYELWINDGPKHVNGHKLRKRLQETGNVAEALLAEGADSGEEE